MKTIAILPGDGIGPEIIAQARKVLGRFLASGVEAVVEEAPVGATAYHLTGDPMPPETFALIKRADAVLSGAIGDQRLDHLGAKRPDAAIGRIRQGLNLCSSLREVVIPPSMAAISPMKAETVSGLDVLIVREMGGDVYFGQPRGQRIASDGPFPGDDEGFDTMRYAAGEVRRIARLAFEAARRRRKRLVSADKANVLETSRLWRRIVDEVAAQYPDVACTHMYADNVAMRLVTRPTDFDVILTPNLLGDILSDIASVLTGSIGLPASALFAPNGQALYEPGHGSAFDIAGQDRANPIGAIRCVGLMMTHSFDRPDLAAALENAIALVLGSGLRTAEIATCGQTVVGTTAMGDVIAAQLDRQLA